jgi:hypothetical protein
MRAKLLFTHPACEYQQMAQVTLTVDFSGDFYGRTR